jgi:hypothetical protein
MGKSRYGGVTMISCRALTPLMVTRLWVKTIKTIWSKVFIQKPQMFANHNIAGGFNAQAHCIALEHSPLECSQKSNNPA